jgi:hypothetical protein
MMEMTGAQAKAGHDEIKKQVAEIFDAVKGQPQITLPQVRARLDAMLADKTIHLTITVGEQVNIKHAWFAVVKVDYPYIILELVEISKGFEHQDAVLRVGDRITWKSAYLQVVQINGTYVGLELTGITERLEKKITLGRARKAINDAGKHNTRTGKRRKARKARR